MNTFAILFFCIQGYLVQNVFSQCYGAEVINAGIGYGPGLPGAAFAPVAISSGLGVVGASAAGLGYGVGASGILGYPGYGAADAAVYGGTGEGNVAVTGELPVAGNTAISGQVPILGAVSFGGNVPAAGSVSISGNCACGCGY